MDFWKNKYWGDNDYDIAGTELRAESSNKTEGTEGLLVVRLFNLEFEIRNWKLELELIDRIYFNK